MRGVVENMLWSCGTTKEPDCPAAIEFRRSLLMVSARTPEEHADDGVRMRFSINQILAAAR